MHDDPGMGRGAAPGCDGQGSPGLFPRARHPPVRWRDGAPELAAGFRRALRMDRWGQFGCTGGRPLSSTGTPREVAQRLRVHPPLHRRKRSNRQAGDEPAARPARVSTRHHPQEAARQVSGRGAESGQRRLRTPRRDPGPRHDRQPQSIHPSERRGTSEARPARGAVRYGTERRRLAISGRQRTAGLGDESRWTLAQLARRCGEIQGQPEACGEKFPD